MKFHEAEIPGVFVIEAEPNQDERGSLSRQFCAGIFREKGLRTGICQSNVSANHRKGTIRGMHFQKPPYQEAKLVSCLRGRVFDVVLDLRKGSSAFGKWQAFDLSEQNARMIYIPEGCAHGFQTLEDQTLLHYQMFAFYRPEAVAGVRYDDPAFGISWPLPPILISERDRSYPNIKIQEFV